MSLDASPPQRPRNRLAWPPLFIHDGRGLLQYLDNDICIAIASDSDRLFLFLLQVLDVCFILHRTVTTL